MYEASKLPRSLNLTPKYAEKSLAELLLDPAAGLHVMSDPRFMNSIESIGVVVDILEAAAKGPNETNKLTVAA